MTTFKNFSKLFDYIQEYKSVKPQNTAMSIGKVFEECGCYYYYDSGTSKVIMIDHDTARLIYMLITSDEKLDTHKNFIASKHIDIDELVNLANKEDLFKGFKMKHLYNDDYLEHVRNQFRMGTTQLILELTGQCNMRCRYCIYHEGYTHNRSFNSKRMSMKIARQAIGFMKLHGDKTEVYITFYGGEPLLEFDVMRDVIEYSKDILKDRSLHFSFTTNLTLLTQEMIRYFSTVKNLSILCSIDGPKEIQDANRIYADGSGTFNDVFENFKALCKAARENEGLHVRANAVYMPPFSKEKVKEIYDFFKGLDFTPGDFRYQMGYAAAGTIPQELLNDSFIGDHSFREWQDEQINVDLNLEEFKEESLLSSLDRIHNRRITQRADNFIPFNGCCVVGCRRLFVSTEGLFFPCERVGNSLSIGSVETGMDEKIIFDQYIYEFSSQWEDICSDCWAAKLCSNCYVDRVNEKGVAPPNVKDCEYFRGVAERNLKNYHHLLRVAPEKLHILNEGKSF